MRFGVAVVDPFDRLYHVTRVDDDTLEVVGVIGRQAIALAIHRWGRMNALLEYELSPDEFDRLEEQLRKLLGTTAHALAVGTQA